ncbi:MAG: RluA family pseudouridine synthase [Leptospiraceae bacterium]|nr:RluA family pseudouridine synthase [Leptospiraceae bacterium]
MQSESIEFQVSESAEGQRLDTWLGSLLTDRFSRSQIARWIEAEQLRLVQQNGIALERIKKRPAHRVQPGERYRLTIPPPAGQKLEPIDLQLPVVYADDYLAVIHKPAGLATHPGPGDDQPSLAHGILHIWKELESSGPDARRPGIVHRLDKATEGLILIGLQDKVRRDLMRQFANREVQKEYRAWLVGKLPAKSGDIELGIRRHPVQRLKMQVHPAGRLSISRFERLEQIRSNRDRFYEHVRVQILTGRTHQIRLHMSHLSCPVVGDPLYSRSSERYQKYGMLLFARQLAFRHPVTAQWLSFELPEPERFVQFARKARFL